MKRTVGRPRATHDDVHIHAVVPKLVKDECRQIARERNVWMSVVIREGLSRGLEAIRNENEEETKND